MARPRHRTVRQIRSGVLRDALVVPTSGLAIGSLFAATLARALASVQYGVTPGDPLSWSIVLGPIAQTTIVASWGPRDSGMVHRGESTLAVLEHLQFHVDRLVRRQPGAPPLP